MVNFHSQSNRFLAAQFKRHDATILLTAHLSKIALFSRAQSTDDLLPAQELRRFHPSQYNTANGKITPELIAPCGMNCGICKAYLSYSRGIPKEKGNVTHCSGCVPRNKLCFIKRGCRKLRQDKIRFCSECEEMPCRNVDRIDRRYRNRYGMSMVENLKEIKSTSLQSFIINQDTK